MNKDSRILLAHIKESLEDIENYTRGLTEKDFLVSRQIQDAVCRRFEIIGEAANALPGEFRAEHSQIPWHKMIGMRNVLIHDYIGVDYPLLWKTVQKDLPELKRALRELEV